jgi:hypothetical protein
VRIITTDNPGSNVQCTYGFAVVKFMNNLPKSIALFASRAGARAALELNLPFNNIENCYTSAMLWLLFFSENLGGLKESKGKA